MAVRSAPIRLPSRGPARAGALLLGAAAIGALVPGKPAFAIALALAAVLAAVVAVDPRRLPVFQIGRAHV